VCICGCKTKIKALIKHPVALSLIFLTSCLLILGLPGILATAQTATAILIAQNQTSLIEQGKALYDAGKYTEAVTVLQQAIANFKTQANPLKQAISLSNLSLAYQQLGLWAEAKTQYQKA
jgi:tetratricopeptide (TPR) repeat protein